MSLLPHANNAQVWHLIFALLSINVTFTFYYLLFVDMFRPHTAIFRCYSILSRSWCYIECYIDGQKNKY
jgi:hypothetical protein